MANAFVSSILSKASQILGSFQRWAISPSSSSDPLSRILKDLKKLERNLTRIQAVLHDAEEREIREEAINLWLKELKEVAYEAEDVLDEYHYEELRAQVEGRASMKRKGAEVDDEEEVSDSSSTMVVSIPDGIEDRIREIRERFDEISEDLERLRLREEDGERRVLGAVYPAPTSHMVEESSIYGREHDKQKVINLLFSEGMKDGISVIPIVGKGGLGKTTIAQLVYNDSKVKECFDLTGWVCVSDDFDVTKLTKDIIESVTQRSCGLTLPSTLQNTIEEKVKGKKVLLVLDDVWNEQRSLWESLRMPFVLGAGIVKIIVTCRNDSVAEIMQTVHPYHPGYLSEDESWLLFKHYAFAGRDSEEQSQLADVGKQIVRKCSGLPLAVKTIGSLLRGMTDQDGWKDVLQSDLWEVDKNNETLAALRLSYSRMPAHLKPCFVYCSMFPKDYRFDKAVLVRLWMAQGYITVRGRRRMEEIGNEYFNDLQRRSFFDSCPKIRRRTSCIITRSSFLDSDDSFKMHDMIHDLAKSIAGNECCTVVDTKQPDFPDGVRHLYMQGEEDQLVKLVHLFNHRALRTLLLNDPYRITVTPRRQSLRTLLLNDPYRGRVTPVTQSLWLHRMTTCLRTLEVAGVSDHGLKYLVSNQNHLRYLHIQFQNIMSLPIPVCHLYHLQTLILDHGWFPDRGHLTELLDGLGNLTNLRYFELRSNVVNRLPQSLCLLHHLQTLILHCHHLAKLPDGLGKLTNLLYFELRSNVVDRLPQSLCLLHHLQTLILHCDVLAKLPDGLGKLTNLLYFELRSDVIERLPGSICQLHNLQMLDVGSCKNLVELPSGIGSLTNLHLLGTDGTRINCLADGIAKLTNLQSLVGHHKAQGAIRALKDLVNLQGTLLISGLRNLVSIEDARDADLKCKHKLERLSLAWNRGHDIMMTLFLKNLHIEASSEENKDVPADEQREEAMLEYLQPHGNLKVLHMIGYAGSKFPKWVGNPFSFASLQEISMNGCENVRSLPLYVRNSLGKLDAPMPPSMLKTVYIWSCRQLTSIVGLHHLHLLKYLTIYDCPQLYLVSEEALPSTLEMLSIRECQQLQSLSGMQNLTSLSKLNIHNCPKLQIMIEDQLPSMPRHVEVIDCPGLVNWCQIQKINCI